MDHVDGGRGWGEVGRGRSGEGEKRGGGEEKEGKEGGNNVITSAAAPAPPGFSALPPENLLSTSENLLSNQWMAMTIVPITHLGHHNSWNDINKN